MWRAPVGLFAACMAGCAIDAVSLDGPDVGGAALGEPSDAGVVDAAAYPTVCPGLVAVTATVAVSPLRSVDIAPSADRALVVGGDVAALVELPSGRVLATDAAARSGVLTKDGRAWVLELPDRRLVLRREEGEVQVLTSEPTCAYVVDPDRSILVALTACRDLANTIGSVGRLERYGLLTGAREVLDDEVVTDTLRVGSSGVAYLRSPTGTGCGGAFSRGAVVVERTWTSTNTPPRRPHSFRNLIGYSPSGRLLAEAATCADESAVWDAGADSFVAFTVTVADFGRIGGIAVQAAAGEGPPRTLGALGMTTLRRGQGNSFDLGYAPYAPQSMRQQVLNAPDAPRALILRDGERDGALLVGAPRCRRVRLSTGGVDVVATGPCEAVVSNDGQRVIVTSNEQGEERRLDVGSARGAFTAVVRAPLRDRLTAVGFAPVTDGVVFVVGGRLHAWVGDRVVALEPDATPDDGATRVVSDARGCWLAHPTMGGMRFIPAPR